MSFGFFFLKEKQKKTRDTFARHNFLPLEKKSIGSLCRLRYHFLFIQPSNHMGRNHLLYFVTYLLKLNMSSTSSGKRVELMGKHCLSIANTLQCTSILFHLAASLRNSSDLNRLDEAAILVFLLDLRF